MGQIPTRERTDTQAHAALTELRDRFATAVAPALLPLVLAAVDQRDLGMETAAKATAEGAYMIADAMLAKRDEEK